MRSNHMLMGFKMDLNIRKDGWKKVRLDEVAVEYCSRINNPSDSEHELFVGSDNIGQWNFRVRSTESTSSVTSAMKEFRDGDYLLVRRSLYASDFRERAPRAHFSGVCSGDILTIREREDILENGFLICILNSPDIWKYIVANASGSITRRIKWSDLKNYEFSLPPKSVQKDLVSLFWSLNSVIESQTKLLNSWGIAFKSAEKELLNCEHYDFNGILDVAKVQRGRFSHRPRNAPEFYGGKVPFIQTSEVVRSDKYIKNYTQTLNEKGLSVSKMFKQETIVMTIAANIGYVGMLGFESAFTDSLIGIHADEELLTQDYLFFYLNSRREEIESLSTQGAQKNLSIDRFKDFQVFYPKDKNEQKIISKKLSGLFSIKNLIENKLSSSEEMMTNLIYRVL